MTGFLRQFTDDNGYNVPNDLLNEIFKWHSQSMIHWIEFGSGNSERRHFAVSFQSLFVIVMAE